MKILIVEDELVIADNLSRLLIKYGYQPLLPAINYSQAVDRINREKPEFAILDINLSGNKTGIDVAQFINDHYPIPFLFLTAFGDDDTLQKAMNAKPFAYLVKPFSKSEIKPTIEIAVMNFKFRQQNSNSNKKELLTEAERKIVSLIAENKTTKQIADEIHLSVSTIKNHRHRICAKLELPPSNNALLTWVMQNW